MTTMYFVCRYCHILKFIDDGRGDVFASTATTAAARHLCESRPGHGHAIPSRAAAATTDSPLRRMLLAGIEVSQAVTNELNNFSIQRFRLAAVGWIVDCNHPISEFENPAFRQMIATANPQAEATT